MVEKMSSYATMHAEKTAIHPINFMVATEVLRRAGIQALVEEGRMEQTNIEQAVAQLTDLYLSLIHSPIRGSDKPDEATKTTTN